MKFVSVPGVNGLGKTKGVENSYLEIFGEGDFDQIVLNTEDIVEQLCKIKKDSRTYFDLGEKVCFFGGDHSISYPLVSNFFEKNSSGKLLIFDAHPDLMEPMPEPSHEEWLRALIEDRNLSGEQVLVLGVRRHSENVDVSEIKYAREKGIRVIYSDEIESFWREILDFVSSGDVYCSFDIDVFDSSIVSCTGYCEKDGLGGKQVFDLLEKIADKVLYWDLVEVNFEKGERGKDLVWKILKTIV